MAQLNELLTQGELFQGAKDKPGKGLAEEYQFVLAQYNKASTDFYKAIGEYLPDVDFNTEAAELLGTLTL
jgi:hypothetical protein